MNLSSTNKEKDNENLIKKNSVSDLFKMQSKKETDTIKLEENINSEDEKLLGLYDPDDYGLDINMWINSDGDQLKNIFSKLKKLNISTDAKEIMKISLLTNSHYNKKYIKKRVFKI